MLRRSYSVGSYLNCVSGLFSSASITSIHDSKNPLTASGIVRDYIGDIVDRMNRGLRLDWAKGDYRKLALALYLEQDPAIRAKIILHIQPQQLHITGLKIALHFLKPEERTPIGQYLVNHLSQKIIRTDYLECLAEYIKTSDDKNERLQMIQRFLARVIADDLVFGKLLNPLREFLSKEEVQLFIPLLKRAMDNPSHENYLHARKAIAYFQCYNLLSQEDLLGNKLPVQENILSLQEAIDYWEQVILKKSSLSNEDLTALSWSVRYPGNDRLVSLLLPCVYKAENAGCVGELFNLLVQAYPYANQENKDMIQTALLNRIKQYWTSDDKDTLEKLFKLFGKIIVELKTDNAQLKYLNDLLLFVKQNEHPDIARQQMVAEVLADYMHFYANIRAAVRLGEVLEAPPISMPPDLSRISQSYVFKI